MTVRELIQKLQRYDLNARVYMTAQPDYPMNYTIGGVVSEEELDEYSKHPDDDDEFDGPDAVYILEGSHAGYGKRDAWEVAR